MIKKAGVFFIVALMVFPFHASADTPLGMVKVNINRILEILRRPTSDDDKKNSAKKDEIRRVTDRIFDYNELSKRTLGQNWKKFSESQRNEFTDLYKVILENAYINKILRYTDETVSFNKEKMLKGKKAEVSTSVITKTVEIPIDYRLIYKKERWGVYDVIIEGVSLISNYRSQFREILMNESPDEFLRILHKKTGAAP